MNRFWLRDEKLQAGGRAFFSFGSGSTKGHTSWAAMRNRWEYSHVARAALSLTALILLATAIALD